MSKKPDILNSDDEPTTELAKNNKIVKPKLITKN